MIYRAVFKFDERNHLGVKATGSEFADFKSNFGNDERGFGYIRIKVKIYNIPLDNFLSLAPFSKNVYIFFFFETNNSAFLNCTFFGF